MDTIEQKRDILIQELVTFSPKYNVVNATRIAGNLDEQTIEKMIVMLQKINDVEATRLDELEEKDPAAYAQAIAAKQQAEEEADNAYFTDLEQQMQEGMAPYDQELDAVKQEIDTVTKQFQALVETNTAEAREMLDLLLKDA